MKKILATIAQFGIAMLILAAIVSSVHAQDVPTPTAEGAVVTATAAPTAEVTPSPIPTPDPAPVPEPVDPATLALGLVLAFVVGLERLMVIVKPFLRTIADRFQFNDETYNALVSGTAVALGIFGVLASNQQLNIFLGFPLLPPLLGTILTGAAAAGGSGLVHVVFDFANGTKQVQNAQVLNAYAKQPVGYVPIQPSEIN